MKFLVIFLSVALLFAPAVSPAQGGQANIFIYHRFGESRYPSTNISLEDFARQLEILSREKVPVLALSEIVQRLRRGEELPPHCAVLTVDDAFRSFLDGAMPLLRRYGFPVTLFVNTDAVGGHQYLDWDELLRLQHEGVEIGHHSAGHPHMVNRRRGEDVAAWQERMRQDLQRASVALERHLGVKPRLFAYPYGEYSSAVQQLVKEAGFEAAVAQQSGVVWENSDLYALPRFPMGGAYATPQQFRNKLFMRPLPIVLLNSPPHLRSDSSPPVLIFRVDATKIDARRINCFIPGQPTVRPERLGGEGGNPLYRVVAEGDIVSRRSKYTLTAPLKTGGWGWFSYLWIRPELSEGGH